MRLSKLIERLAHVEIIYNGEWEREVTSLCMDSRKLQKGGVFFCISGGKIDAHEFVKEVEQKGAVAIIAQRKVETKLPLFIVEDTRKTISLLASIFYGEPSKRLKIIGITGTNGKTTTSYMLSSILEKAGKKVGVIGTLGVAYGKKILPANLTTPDPIELHERLAEMVFYGIEYVVMEVSAHSLYYRKVEGISFVACVFTNFTQDHLDFFMDMNKYKEAKLALFTPEICPIAILNGDDEVGRELGKMRERLGGDNLFYGLDTPSDCFAIITNATLRGTECMFNLNDKLSRVRLKMLGLHNVYNALAAAACAEALGEGLRISEGLSSLDGVKGRLEWIKNDNRVEVYVDFAHTPDGLAKSLDTLKKYCKGRLICLFGCGGNRDKSKRAVMGETAAKKTDFTILTSDNPRYEDPLDIITDIEKGYRRFSTRYVIVPDRKLAIGYALEFMRKEDILLIAGKGGEEYQEIMGIKYPFNDQDIVEKLLEQKGKNLS